jgi:arylsulfate sulfotransferase
MMKQIKAVLLSGSFLVICLAFFVCCEPVTSGNNPGLFDSDVAVALNPSGIAPLTAVADFTTTTFCRVKVEVTGDVEVVKEFENFDVQHSIPILGLYPGQANTVVITVFSSAGASESKTLSITTDPLPDIFPQIEINTARPEFMEPGMNLCALCLVKETNLTAYPIIFDNQGKVRWYLDLTEYKDFCLPMERASNGNLVFAVGNSICEMTMLGELANKITLPGYNFHHDIIELPDGHFVGAVDKEGSQIVKSTELIDSVEDHMVEVDRETGAVVTEWDFRKILDVDRNEQYNSTGDWFHQNSVWYSEKDDCFIVSGRIQGVAKITRDNQLKWILAPHLGWENSGYDGSGFDTSPFLLTAVKADGEAYDPQIQEGALSSFDFDWPWGQHAAMILPDGDIFLYDNGAFRNFSTGTYSRAVEYRVDEEDMTVQQVWEYGKDRGPEMFSTIISDVDYLPLTQNRLITSGIVRYDDESYSKIIEVSYPDQIIYFEATIHFNNVPSATPGFGLFDFIYRSERLSIYP